MYQSPYFVEECKKKMSPISNWGFVLSEEISDDRWALLGWELEDIRIAIEYHPYAFTLTTYIDYRREHIDVRKLYDQAGIDEKYIYQFGGTGLEKGIESITGTVLVFLDLFDRTDHTDLMNAVRKVYEQRESAETSFLKAADQAYLFGDFDTAKNYYQRYEYALNDVQKKRLKRLMDMK